MDVPMIRDGNVCLIDSSSLTNGDRSESGDAPVLLHPLVVINISDHFNRYAAKRLFPEQSRDRSLDAPLPATLEDSSGVRVMGVLLGDSSGRSVDVCHSFELPVAEGSAGELVITPGYLDTRIEQYAQIFPHYHVVGWYTTGPALDNTDHSLHTEVFSKLTDGPVVLLMNIEACLSSLMTRLGAPRAPPYPTATSAGRKPAGYVPAALAMYHAELRLVDGAPHNVLVPVRHRFASADSERIAVEHVSRHAGTGGGAGGAAQHLGNLRRSVGMLGSRVDVLLRFLDATERGEVPVDHALLRKVAGVCDRLPEGMSREFVDAFEHQQKDALMVNYLAGLTKTVCSVNELVEDFSRGGFDRMVVPSSRRRV